jgi:hypothetical protein
MEQPTCPDELRNELIVIDLTLAPASEEMEPTTSLDQGLSLAAKYLQSSVKPSTLCQVIYKRSFIFVS